MNNRSIAIAVVIVAFAQHGCASHPEPIIDMQGVDPAAMHLDWEECESYSHEVVIAEGTAKGAAGGAVIGAATGAISGDADRGAGYGAIWGATRSGIDGSRERQMVFKRCMRGRGYRVLN